MRRWLIEMGYMGEGTPPVFTDEFRVEIARRYIEVCERITGTEFKAEVGPALPAIQRSLEQFSF